MGQTHRRRAVCVVGFHVGQPAQLGYRDRRQRHHADGIRPRSRPAQLGHQRRRCIRRAGVIPQQRRSHRVAVAVEAHQAVLLGRDRDSRHIVEPTGGRDGASRRGFPSGRIDFGAVRMWGATLAHDLTRARIADHNLARLRRRVDAGDQCHGRPTCVCSHGTYGAPKLFSLCPITLTHALHAKGFPALCLPPFGDWPGANHTRLHPHRHRRRHPNPRCIRSRLPSRRQYVKSLQCCRSQHFMG